MQIVNEDAVKRWTKINDVQDKILLQQVIGNALAIAIDIRNAILELASAIRSLRKD